jgi:hypothetical protein
MVHVAALDPHAEGALKVIQYYDALVEHAATLEACVRASASLSRCVAGLLDQESAWSVRYNEAGVAVEGVAAPSMKQVVRVETSVVGEVWLERRGAPEELDELVLERFARAAGALWRRAPRAARSIGSVLESVLSSDVAPESAQRLLRRLGFDLERPIDVAAVLADDVAKLTEQLTSVRDGVTAWSSVTAPAVCAALGNVGAVIAQSGPCESTNERRSLPFSCGARVGFSLDCSPSALSEGWREANAAAQFARILGYGSAVDYRDLGSLELLAGIVPDRVAANKDVQKLRELADSPRGREAVQALEAVLVHGSVRQAAAAIYLHHSTLHYRMAQIEMSLGFGLQDQQGRVRAAVAVALWRLLSRWEAPR